MFMKCFRYFDLHVPNVGRLETNAFFILYFISMRHIIRLFKKNIISK